MIRVELNYQESFLPQINTENNTKQVEDVKRRGTMINQPSFFDFVITESVTAFSEYKQKAVNEYVRVTKPGGYVGLNESTWLKFPPPPELLDWISQGGSDTGEPLSSSQWANLLENAELKNIVVRTNQINIKEESKAIVKRYRFGGMLAILGRMFSLYINNPAYRKFVREAQKGIITPRNLDQFFGYGLFVGQK
ncbi:MAG: methyltransferase domain-containing protein [Chloroflexota bacterium]|nr:methyltransferase domain-containing protein [Chloroflexota bacterium]